MAEFFITGGKPKAFFFNGGKANQVYLAGAALLSAGFSITCEVEHGTCTGPATIVQGGTATLTIAPTSPYVLPSAIMVIGADYTYSDTTGEIVLSNPTGNVSVLVVCAVAYNMTVSVTNGSADITTGYVAQGGSRTITLSANANCTLPSSVTVSNASYTYDNTTGTIVVSNPTGDVTVSARCRTATWDGVTYVGTKWKFKDITPNSSSPVNASDQYYGVGAFTVYATLLSSDGETVISTSYTNNGNNDSNRTYHSHGQLGSYYTYSYWYRLFGKMFSSGGINELKGLYLLFEDRTPILTGSVGVTKFTTWLKGAATIVDW